jgi:hypothetical protein
MNLRNFLLIGLALCVLMLAVIAIFNPGFRQLMVKVPAMPALMTMVLVWNAYAAIRWTRPVTIEDSMVLHLGVRWGLAIGCAWALVAIVPFNVFAPLAEFGVSLWLIGLFSGVLIPFVCGASVAIKTENHRMGMRVGFWGGVVGGLMGFLIFIATLFAGGGAEKSEFALEGSVYAMFVFGSLYGGIAGGVGGWNGLRLYRTGEPTVGAALS